jgi:hypothetical protein
LSFAKPADSAISTTDASATASAKEPVTNQKALDATWIKVADEGQSFSVPNSTVVQYGAGTTFASPTLSGNVVCGNAVFGDPLPGVVKACYVQTAAATGTAPASGTKLASEGGSFTLPAATIVAYGSDPNWVELPLSGTVVCSNGTFGRDPYPNVLKGCFSKGAATSGGTTPAAGALIANEGASFTLASSTVVKYGVGSSWVKLTVSGGQCTNAFFGSDPAPGILKACFVDSASTTPPVVEVPPTTIAPVAGDVIDGSGNVSATAYRSMAALLSKDAGIAYRYGPDAASNGVTASGLPTLYKRNDNVVNNPPFKWQVGSYTTDHGMYANNHGNVAFAADDPSQRMGVSDIQVTSNEFNTFMQLPQLPWQLAMAPGGGIDSITALDYKAKGIVSGDPVAIGRCGGAPGWCTQSLVAFQNGVIASTGSNTAANKSTVKLASGKVPTAITMTNGSEFALVTVWDTVNLKGQVAVIALAGLCDGCNPYSSTSPRSYYDWWHEWMAPYPGLPNMGNFAFMKILGYIDLPGVNAPTEITVTTGLHPFKTAMPDGQFMGYTNPLTSQANRDSFNNGANSGRYAKGGVAVVISKSEKKATFIDLKPLFTYVNGVYFGGSQTDFNATMATLGQADNQWPHAFAYKPQAMPTIIKTIAMSSPPTAVKNTPSSVPARTWLATQDGTMHLFSLGGYATGAAASAGDIAETGSVNVGRNPTSIAISKANPDPDGTSIENRSQVIVAARGDRKVQWVRLSTDGNSASVVRTLQDTRLIDPIAVEDADNFATRVNTVSVTDYAGKQVSNFRFGNVVFAGGGSCPAPNGCGVSPTGGINIEYGGSFALPGKPFQMSTSNVP